jgi:hypothetical protein
MMVAHSCGFRLPAVLTGLGLVVVLGCSGDDLGRRYPVSGTVSYKGQPLARGLISFRPTGSEGRAASGEIKGGTYSLATAGTDDGAFPGSYRVSIIAREEDAAKAFQDAKEKSKTGMIFPQKVALQSHNEAKKLIPVKYESPEQSGLTAEVKEQPNKINFDLTD